MDQQLKQRVIGAAVLVALLVIFVPIFLDRSVLQEPRVESHDSPQPPEDSFNSRVVPLDENDLAAVEDAASASPEILLGTGVDEHHEVQDAVPEPVGDHATGSPSQSKTRTGVTAWVVQVGSFTSVANAEALETRLRAGGYKAFVEKLRDETGTAYRVRIGPELSRSKADEILARVEKEIDARGIVMRYP